MSLDATSQTMLQGWTPRILSLLRIVSGLLLLQFGTAKVLGFPSLRYFAAVELLSLTEIAGLIELVLSPLLIAGLYTRPVAFILSGQMACAYFIGHGREHFIPLMNGGTLAALLCFVFLYLAFAGGGSWSLDAVLRRKS